MKSKTTKCSGFGCVHWTTERNVYCDFCALKYIGLGQLDEVGGGSSDCRDCCGFFRADEVIKAARKKMIGDLTGK